MTFYRDESGNLYVSCSVLPTSETEFIDLMSAESRAFLIRGQFFPSKRQLKRIRF